jgi:hypothetical protein
MSTAENTPATPPKPVTKAEAKAGARAEVKPVTKPETKPTDAAAVKAEAKPADKSDKTPVAKVENRQAGKGSKRRPFNAKKFSANYESIRWNKGPTKKPKH